MSRSIFPHRARLTPAALVLLLVPTTAPAVGLPLVDVRAEIGQWGATPTGSVASNGDDFDVEDDLGYDRNNTTTFMAELEHPIPVLPNVRVRRSGLSDDTRGTMTASRTFGGVTFSDSERVQSSYDLEFTDATFYYSPLNNWVALDVGITARHIDADVRIESRDDGDSERAKGSVWLPMGHLGARVDLPLTGVYARGEVNAISAGDNSMQDSRVSLGWEMTSNFGLAIGYRQMSFESDELDDLNADIDVKGPFATATLRF